VRRTHNFATLGSITRFRPRYLLHGVAVVVGFAAVTSVALQPRHSVPISEAATATEVTVPMVALEVATVEPTAAVVEDQPVAATPEPEVEQPAPVAKPSVHTVEEGETLRMLAARFGLNPETIMAANSLQDADMLQIGQDLVIPPTDGVLYTVKPGESIRRVAERFGVDTMEIVKANDLGPDPDVVQPGTQLMVPGATPAVAGDTAADTVQSGDDSDQQAAVVGVPVEVSAHPAAPSTRTYEVQSGDTLAGIADTFGVDVDTILSNNGIDDPDTIKPGSELRILPVKGVEYAVQPNETLADISFKYQVDLGLLLDYNDLNDPDVIRIGAKLVIPGGKPRADSAPAPAAEAAPRTQSAPAAPAIVQVPSAPKPAAAKPAAPKPAPAPAPAAPSLSVGSGGGVIVANAMKYVGYRYVFGGTSPAGFDCSGFVYYIHNHSGAPVGRGMWQQYNGGTHIPMSALQPGDTLFFANTYMPGLSHDGIYIGNGQFVHASDERTGVTVSSLYSAYWQGHYVGATRLWD
jgi:cell wall-associated NlpC family hydrolase